MRVILLSLFLLFPHIANAGAWLQEKGLGEANINYTYFSSNKSYDQHGKKQTNAGFAKSEVNPYFEYGLFDELTIGGSFSYQSIVSAASVQRADSLRLSYYDIFARSYLRKTDDYVVSIEPRLHIPVNSSATTNPEGDAVIPELKLAFGAPFKLFDEYSFVDIGAIYRLRDEDTLNNELKDMLKLEATLGLKLESDILLLSQIFHEESLGRKTGDNTPGNFDLTKLQLSLAYDYWETIFLQAGIFTNIDGVNTSAGNGMLFSVWYKF